MGAAADSCMLAQRPADSEADRGDYSVLSRIEQAPKLAEALQDRERDVNAPPGGSNMHALHHPVYRL